MAKNSPNGSSSRTPKLFARRQVYLRTGQDSQYVELSPMLQIGVAVGFGALALWLVGASYGAASSYLSATDDTALMARLGSAEQALKDAVKTRDAALEDAARVADLEAELIALRTDSSEGDGGVPPESGRTEALTTELERAKSQLEELHVRLSESKADQAALKARFEAEALATSDASAKTAEEAASLHGQLEEAFGEIDALRSERDELSAQIAEIEQQKTEEGETTERNAALLKAATAEIERLQEAIAETDSATKAKAEEQQATIARLETERDDALEGQDTLTQQVADLNADLEAVRAGAAEAEAATLQAAAEPKSETELDAALQAQSIAAGLREADLLAEIETLRADIAANQDAAAEDDEANVVAADGDDEEVTILRQRVAAAEAEIERLILVGLSAENPSAPAPTPALTPAVDDDPAEIERLRAELVAARADIIKLNADVKAAKQRLAENAVDANVQAAKTDNSAKLEQQLASTRSRVQQLNKALADAKLREVAIDLALINIVPTPSPPAPR